MSDVNPGALANQAPEPVDDALEAALALRLAGGTAGAGAAPVLAALPTALAAEVRSLLPIAAALEGVPALDPARRAAMGALLASMAAEPGGNGSHGDDDGAGGGDGPAPIDGSAAPLPARAPDAGPAPAVEPGGSGRGGALFLAGVVALLALAGAAWRLRTPGDAPFDPAGMPGAAFTSPSASLATSDPASDAASASESAALAARARSTADGTAAADRTHAAATTPVTTRSPGAGTTGSSPAVGRAQTTPAGRAGRTPVSGNATAALPAPVSIATDAPPPDPPDPPATDRRPAPKPSATPPPTVTPAPPPGPSWADHPCAALVQPNALVARVVNGDGLPLADAIISLFAVGQPNVASSGGTDGNGCVAIEQSPGRYDVLAEAAGHAPRWYPGSADRSGAVAVDVDGRLAMPPIDVPLPDAAGVAGSATPTAGPPATAEPPAAVRPPLGDPPAAVPTVEPAPARPTAEPTAAAAPFPFGLDDRGGRNGGAIVDVDAVAGARAAHGPAAVPSELRARLAALAEFAQDGGTVAAVAVADGRVWAVVGPRVVGWSAAALDAGAAARVAWTPVLPEVPAAVAVDGARLVVAVSGEDGAPATVWLFDIAGADDGVGGAVGELAAVGACPLALTGAATVSAVAAADTWVYVLTERGLSVIDAKRAAAPVEVGRVDAPATPAGRANSGLALLGDGTHVLIARSTGLQVVDVRAPLAPAVVFQGVPRDIHAVASDGGALAVAVEAVTGRLAGGGVHLRLLTLDVSDPARPRAVSAVPLPEATGQDAESAAGSTGGIRNGARAGAALRGDTATVVYGDGRTLWVVDAADPTAPTVSKRLPLATGAAGAAALAMDARGATALALGDSGLRWLSASAMAQTEPAGDVAPVAPADILPPIAQVTLADDGGAAWAAGRDAGVLAIDIRPGAVRWRLGAAAALAPDGAPADVTSVLSVGRHVFALTRRAGLQVFDGADPAAPRRLTVDDDLGRIDGGDEAVQMAASLGALYVPDATGAVQVIDLRQPATPRLVGRLAGVGDAGQRLVALAAQGTAVHALTTDGRTSRVYAIDVGTSAEARLDGPRLSGPPVALVQAYHRMAFAGDRLVLSGDRQTPTLAVLDLADGRAVEVPGLAAGAVGLIDLPGGVRRALVADGAFLTAVDLGAFGDADRRISGRSVRLPLGAVDAGGGSDVLIVGGRVFVARAEAGLFARLHGGIALPGGPESLPPVVGAPTRGLTYTAFLPSLLKDDPPCRAPERMHGVLLIDASPATAAWAGPVAAGPAESGDLGGLRPGVAAWLDGLGVGPREGTSASIVLWDRQTNRLATGADPLALMASLTGRRAGNGRRVDLALHDAAIQLRVNAGAATATVGGRVVLLAAEDWPADVQARALDKAAALRAEGWRIAAIALGSGAEADAVAARLTALSDDAAAVMRVPTAGALPAAMAATGRGAWRCGR